MKQLYLQKCFVLFLCLATILTSYAQTKETVRLTQTATYYGDWQGEAESGTPTKYKHHYYNEHNLLVGTVELVPQVKDSETTLEIEKEGDQIPERFTVYNYDNAGNLLSIRERNFSIHDGYYRSWTDFKDLETYSYDKEGNLSKKTTTSSTSEYLWNEGNIIEEKNLALNGDWNYTIVYSNFLEGFKNCPKASFKTGKYSSSNKIGEYIYDEKGRVLQFTEYDFLNPVKDEAGNIVSAEKGSIYSQEVYTYDGELMTSKIISYWNKAQEMLVPSTKTENVLLEGKIKTTNYTYVASKDSWSIFGSPVVYTSAEYTSTCVPSNFSATQVEGETNTILLSCDKPETVSEEALWYVFRNGVKIGEATVANGKISYKDALLKNGTYSYFIQYASAERPEGVNITTPIETEVSTDLPNVSNIRAVYKGQVTEGSNKETKQYNVALVEWDAPETDLKILGYNVYTDIKYYHTNPYPINGSTLLSATQSEVKWETSEKASHTIYVEAVYEFGKKRSEPFAFVVEGMAQRKVETIYTLGDIMGDTQDNKISKVEKFYYDAHNNLVCSATGAYLMGDDTDTPKVETEGDILPYDFTIYDYNEKQQLVKVRTRKYGVYSGYDKAWNDFDEVESYEYNAEGKLCKKTDKARSYAYTWEGNNMVREVETVVSSGSMTYDITYSKFLEGVDNLPQYAVKNAPYSSNQRIFEYTYDEQLRLVRSVVYKYGNKELDEEGNIISVEKGTIDYEEIWVYTDDELTLYEKNIWKNNKNTYEPRIKKVYTKTELGMREDTYSYSVGIWTKSGTPKITDTTKHYAQTAVTKFTLTETAPNTIKITCTIPELTFGSPTYNIFRNGIVIGQASGYGNTVTFVDKDVPNGTWDYFIQAADNFHNIGINISDIKTYQPATELPAVKSIREVENMQAEDGDYHLTVEWDTPETDFTILGYNIYTNIMSYTKNPSPVNGPTVFTDRSYTFQWSSAVSTKQTIYVETVYNIGKVKSAPFEINLNGNAVGVINTSVKKGVQFENNTLKVSEQYYTVKIYNLNGVCVGSSQDGFATTAGEKSISLSELPIGIYTIRLTSADGIETIKVLKK